MRATMLPSSWAASSLIHASAFGALALGAQRAEPLVPRTEVVEFRMDPSPAPKAPVPDEPPTSEEPAKPSPRAASPRPTVRAPASAPTAAHVDDDTPAKGPPDAPLDFTAGAAGGPGAFTMTAGGGGGHGGSGGGGGGGPASAPTRAPEGPRITSQGELSRPPAPPDLSARLLASYPSRAKAAGDAGSATLSLVVLADGSVTSLEIRRASAPEFGRACIDTVRGSRWSSPLDKNGQPTGTRVGYTCTFDVR